MELYIIELPKFIKYKENKKKQVDSCLKFIENPEVVNMDENAAIKKAQKELEKISSDEHERYLAELREKYIMDQKATEDAGYYKGIKEGIEEGIKEGEIKRKRKRKKRRERKCSKKIITAKNRY